MPRPPRVGFPGTLYQVIIHAIAKPVRTGIFSARHDRVPRKAPRSDSVRQNAAYFNRDGSSVAKDVLALDQSLRDSKSLRGQINSLARRLIKTSLT